MKKSLTLCLFLSALAVANAQWYNTMGPGPNNITGISGEGNTIYVSSNGNGIHVSPDSGATWHSLNNGLPNLGIISIYEKKGVVLAGGFKLYRSEDKGNTWTTTTVSGSIKKFYEIGDTVYAMGSTLLKSGDLGKTWKAVPYPNNSNGSVGAFYQNGNLMLCGIDQYGMYRSTDYGKNWTKTNKGLDTTKNNTVYVSSLSANGNSIYTGTGNGISGGGKLYISSDAGLSWTPVKAPFTDSPSGIVFLNNKIYISSNGVFSSADNGANWKQHLPKSVSDPQTYTSLYTNGQDLYAPRNNGFQASDGNIFKTYNDGLSFKPVLSGITAKQTQNLVFSGDTIYGSSGIVSYNNGNTWKYLTPNVPAPLRILAKKGNKIFANPAGNTLSYGIYVSTDNYKTWAPANTGMYQYGNIPKMLFKNDTIFVLQTVNSTFGSESGVYFSANNGTSWTKAANTGFVGAVDFSISGDYMYAAATNGGVYVSTNSAKNWTKMTSPAFPQYNTFNMIQAIGDTVYTTGYNIIFKSLDKGMTWAQVPAINQPTTQGNLLNISRIGNRLYAGVDYYGVYYSENNGLTWKSMVDGFPSGNNTSTFNILQNNGRLFAMTTSGFFQRSAAGGDPFTLGLNDFPNVSVEEVFVVYPNPGSGSVTLSSQIASHFKLMDQAGRTVLEKDVEGQMKVNISQLHPGVYFYNFNNNKTRKFIVE